MIAGLPVVGRRPIDVAPDTGLSVGLAAVQNFNADVSHIGVGIKNLSGKSKLPFAPVSDLAFTRTVVALYHEYGHYFQNYRSGRNAPCFSYGDIRPDLL